MKIDITEITGTAPTLPPVLIIPGQDVTIDCPPPHKWLLTPSMAERMINDFLVSRASSIIDVIAENGDVFSFVEAYQVSNFIAHGSFFNITRIGVEEQHPDAIIIGKRWVAALKDVSNVLVKYAKKRDIHDAVDSALKAIVVLNQTDLCDRLVSGKCVAESFNYISDAANEIFRFMRNPRKNTAIYEISQKIAARAMGISVRELQRWEKGTVDCPIAGYSKLLRQNRVAFFDWVRDYKSRKAAKKERARGDVVCDIR